MKALAEYLLFQISAKANCFDILYHHLKVVAIQKFKNDFPVSNLYLYLNLGALLRAIIKLKFQ